MEYTQEQLERARARNRELTERIWPFLKEHIPSHMVSPVSRDGTILNASELASRFFRGYVWGGASVPSDAALKAAVQSAVTGPSPANARAKYHELVALREKQYGRPLRPEERRAIQLECGFKDDPPPVRIKDAISQAALADARKRYEAAFNRDWRDLSVLEQHRITRNYQAIDRANEPDTRASDAVKAAGEHATLAERMAAAREGNGGT